MIPNRLLDDHRGEQRHIRGLGFNGNERLPVNCDLREYLPNQGFPLLMCDARMGPERWQIIQQLCRPLSA